MSRRAGSIAGIILLAVLIEVFRTNLHVPVTLLDIIILPLILIVIYIFASSFFTKSARAESSAELLSPLAATGLVFMGLAMLALGAWALWAGFHEPLTLFTSVKGALHGYTLGMLGLGIFILGLVFIWTVFSRLWRR